MNFSTRIKRSVVVLMLCSIIGAAALSHAATTAPAPVAAKPAVADVASTRIDSVANPTANHGNARATTRVHVGRPIMVSANPTRRQIERAAR